MSVVSSDQNEKEEENLEPMEEVKGSSAEAEARPSTSRSSSSEWEGPVLRQRANRPAPVIGRAIQKAPRKRAAKRNTDFTFEFAPEPGTKGRKRNKNYCAICKNGGFLYCCDGCPSSFHAQCHFPNIDIDASSDDDFYCRSCSMLRRMRSDPETFKYRPRNDGSDEVLPEYFHNVCMKMLTVKTSFFTIPKSVTSIATKIPRPMPNDDLAFSKRKRPDQDSDCYICNRPVAHPDFNKCQFCPVVIHLDCHTEPMTARRIYAWRCPYHVENFLDVYMLDTTSVVKRAQLYQKYAKKDPVGDEEKILLRCVKKLAQEDANWEAAKALAMLKQGSNGLEP